MGIPQHSERLAAYWAEALGGPSDYTDSMGDQSGVVRLHSGNGEHVEMDERAQICFAQALDDAGLPDDSRLRSTLKAYFRWLQKQWPPIRSRRRKSRRAWFWRGGRGMARCAEG